jgi:hypothetical protein
MDNLGFWCEYGMGFWCEYGLINLVYFILGVYMVY